MDNKHDIAEPPVFTEESQTPFGFGGGLDKANILSALKIRLVSLKRLSALGVGWILPTESRFLVGNYGSQTPFGFGGGLDTPLMVIPD